MVRLSLALSSLAACPSEPTIDGHPAVVSAGCEVDPTNALRATCTIDLDKPDAAEVTLSDGDESVRFTDAASTADHVIPVWGLVANTEWSWSVAGQSGSFTTGALPSGLALRLDLQSYGASGLVDVMLPTSCQRQGAYVVAFDAGGRVRWYQDFSSPTTTPGAGIEAFQWTEDDTVVAMVSQEEWAEADLVGHELVRVNPDWPLHHDLFHRNGLTWALQAQTYVESDGYTWVEDRVVAYDRSGAEVDSWDEHGHLVPSTEPQVPNTYWQDVFPGARDAWHTNGVYVTEDDDLVLSSLRVATLFQVKGGEVGWVLAGDGVGEASLPSTLSFTGPGQPDFHRQHDPALLPDGHVTVFDNDHTRGLELGIDPAAGTAWYVGSWTTQGLLCAVQGSVFPFGDARHLVTCATEDQLLEYDADDQLVTRATVRCDQGAPSAAIRGQPMDLWAAHVGTVTAQR